MVTVIVPWRAGCPQRQRAWEWVQARYACRHPGWTIVQAQAPDGPWCKATAVMPAIAAARDDVVVVADADVWCNGLQDAVDAVRNGLVAWAIPHLLVRRLTEPATAALLAGGAATETCERPYRGLQGGGVVVARRDVLLDTPLDHRFTGWGQEDASWAVALRTLHGQAWRGSHDLIHLHHPPQERATRKVGSPAGQLLHRRYLAARRDPARMRALLQETR